MEGKFRELLLQRCDHKDGAENLHFTLCHWAIAPISLHSIASVMVRKLGTELDSSE